MNIARTPLIFALVCLHGIPLALGGEKEPQAVKVAWETDYGRAMDLANRQQKMLVIFFHNPSDPQSQRLQTETLENAEVQQKLQDFVCLRLPVDAKATADDKEIVLLQHASLSEMLGRPGVAIADFAHADPKLHGCIVSVFPLTGSLFYGPAQMQVILDLPPGSLTQRTLIYAVRIHPEKPSSALGRPDRACWPRRKARRSTRRTFASRVITAGMRDFPRIAAMVGGLPREVCAESWPGQRLVESAIECVRCWRLSSGHWSARAGPQSGLRLRHETRVQRRLVRNRDFCGVSRSTLLETNARRAKRTLKSDTEMPNPRNQEVLIPFLKKKKVPLIVDVNRHPAIKQIKSWGAGTKKLIEEACFANYKDKVASIGLNPSLPRIRKANEVWKHLTVESVQIDACVDDAIVVHLVPAWDIDLQMELCIKGSKLVYSGQFLLYPVDG